MKAELPALRAAAFAAARTTLVILMCVREGHACACLRGLRAFVVPRPLPGVLLVCRGTACALHVLCCVSVLHVHV